jgi:hypothetical protein
MWIARAGPWPASSSAPHQTPTFSAGWPTSTKVVGGHIEYASRLLPAWRAMPSGWDATATELADNLRPARQWTRPAPVDSASPSNRRTRPTDADLASLRRTIRISI